MEVHGDYTEEVSSLCLTQIPLGPSDALGHTDIAEKYHARQIILKTCVILLDVCAGWQQGRTTN